MWRRKAEGKRGKEGKCKRNGREKETRSTERKRVQAVQEGNEHKIQYHGEGNSF
jgi:hypothetical protein